ncbi:hypothetical protein [Psychroserpens sp.]|uniref:hypothetical protein n=1 Tax=Psychroserpens sp. TaxID=2020870 RepID=UPI003858CC96
MKRILVIICIFSLFFSCSNDDSNTPEAQIENFYALTVGNSWEYRWYSFNPQAGLNPTNVTESISIVDTQSINGNLFYKFKRVVDGNDIGNITFPDNGEYFEYYRDSLGFLVNELGGVKFVNSTTEEFVILDYQANNYAAFGQLANASSEFITEAGTFNCLEMKIRYEDEFGNNMPAINRHFYADGIGLIKDEVVFIASPDSAGHQRRLESYDIQ